MSDPTNPVEEGVTSLATQTTADVTTPQDAQANATDGTADNAATGAPETYEDFTMPEGVELDKEVVDQFVPIAKELGLSQEQAQKLVDLQTSLSKSSEEARSQNWANLQKTWVDSAKSDQEYGGQQFEANMAVARQALDKWGTPELKAMMDATGAGNHPEMLRFFYRVGKEMSEDKVVTGGNPKGDGPRDVARLLFPSMN